MESSGTSRKFGELGSPETAQVPHYAEGIQAVVPWNEQVMIILDKHHHIRLRALLIKLGMYKVKWKVGPNRWQLGGALFRKSCSPCPEVRNEEIPLMEHQAQVLKMPAQVSLDTLDNIEDATYVLQFDGGTIRKCGVGGVLVWGLSGQLLMA